MYFKLPHMYIATPVHSTWEDTPKPLNNIEEEYKHDFYVWKMYFVTAIFLTEILL